MVHALTLLAILLVLAPLAKFVPLATLAAVLFVVAYNMSEWREIGGIFRTELADIIVWLVTFVLTVVADLTVAVEVGHGAGRASLHLPGLSDDNCFDGDAGIHQGRAAPHTAGQGRSGVCQHPANPWTVPVWHYGQAGGGNGGPVGISRGIVILRLRNMTAIDATGLHAFEVLSDRLKKAGRTLMLCGACHQPARIMSQVEFVEHIGEKNIVPHVQDALSRAHEIQADFSGFGEEVASEMEHIRL